jgi:hypothetical protein
MPNKVLLDGGKREDPKPKYTHYIGGGGPPKKYTGNKIYDDAFNKYNHYKWTMEWMTYEIENTNRYLTELHSKPKKDWIAIGVNTSMNQERIEYVNNDLKRLLDFYGAKLFMMNRSMFIKNELLARVWFHPSKIEKCLEMGAEVLDMYLDSEGGPEAFHRCTGVVV